YRPDFCSSVSFWYQKTIAKPWGAFPPVNERINAEIFLDTADMADQIKTSPGVTATRQSNRVCNLKRALYVANSRVGGWFEVPCRVAQEGKYSISVFQCLYRTGGIWKVTLRGPTGETVLDQAMDFFDPYLAWQENRPENFLYGTWFEKKVGIHKLTKDDYVFRFECVGANPLARAEASDEPGLNCRLDGISLRRFPWDDLYGQMQRYLADEKKLFDGMVGRAKEAVAALDAAAEQFHKDTGEYPRSLDELAERPQRFSQTTGHWPYVAGISADPWGQRYRYERPGKFNPDRFDVYSVHGDSRDPAGWIGNWPSPFRIEGAIEGEDLQVQQKSAAVKVSRQQIAIASYPPLSQGQLLFIQLRRKGDSVVLALPRSIAPGRYALKVRMVTSWDYAVVSFRFNAETVGQPVDTYSPTIGAKTIVLGNVDVRSEGSTLRIEATDRNPASAGYFAGIDAVTLSPAR
ncbi:type II secretion system protein GspG, partial [Candidatus Sumerlaeota bacterium]|nr:type II secretion system protein GspG [Candidatus Sumerlaeota bacterium]